jgi:hypothetical protein
MVNSFYFGLLLTLPVLAGMWGSLDTGSGMRESLWGPRSTYAVQARIAPVFNDYLANRRRFDS